MKKSARVSEKLVSPGLPGLQEATRLIVIFMRAANLANSQSTGRQLASNWQATPKVSLETEIANIVFERK